MDDGLCKMSIFTAMEIYTKHGKMFVHKPLRIPLELVVLLLFIKNEQNIGRDISVQGEENKGLLRTWNRIKVTVLFEKFVYFDDNIEIAGTFTD